MSSFTQFTGSNVPFGQLVPLWDDRNNPTVNGIEYLKTGVIKGLTGYSSLVSDFPSLGLNVQTGTAYGYTGAANSTHFYLTDGTRYYVFSNNATPNYGTSVTSAWTTSLSGGNAVNDVCRFGTSGTLIAVGNTTSNNFYVSGTSGTAFTTTGGIMKVVASNTAGTLAVLGAFTLNGGAGYIYTSTNGTTWTSRTPTAGAGEDLVRAMWSPVGNCFVYINSAATVYTTTDGFTLTSRGVPTNLVVGTVGTGLGNNNHCASSASSTLFAVTQNSVRYIVKTTNGTSYTATAVSSLFPNNLSTTTIPPKLVYMNGAYYALFSQPINYPQSNLYKSVDEGATWTAVANIFIAPYARASNGPYFIDYVNVFNGNIIATSIVSAATAGVYGVLSSYDTANFIGLPYGTAQLAGLAVTDTNVPNYYVRIK